MHEHGLVRRFFFSALQEPAGSWKQPPCFLLAISSSFSEVRLSNQLGGACQGKLLFNFFKAATQNIFLKGNQTLKNHTGT